MDGSQRSGRRQIKLLLLLLIALFWLPVTGVAQEQAETADPAPGSGQSTLETLSGFVELRADLIADIRELNKQLAKASSEAEKVVLRERIAALNEDLDATARSFENIAAGVDITGLRGEPQEEFNLQREVFSLIRPAIDEMKEMTSRIRQKSELKKKIAFYEERLPVVEQALASINRLIAAAKDQQLIRSLKATAAQWEKQQAFMQSELRGALLQLQKLAEAETSLAEASQSYLKSFFQKRGLYLALALLVVIAIVLLSRLTVAGMQRYIPGFRAKHRSFRVRLFELLHRIFTTLFIILGPMAVFYVVEDGCFSVSAFFC